MDRELLIELGCEELPASWLPGVTQELGEVVFAELRDRRLAAEAPAETYSTPRRLTVRVARVPERQTDLEELVNGPPVSAAFKPDGTPTPAASGFAAKQGVEVAALERVQTPKGEYLAFRKRQRGRAAVDVLPDVLTGTLRRLTFPKMMRWDAELDDGRGELLFGRPIRWILFLYGGRVVPFAISRTSAAETAQVQDVPSGAVTYGHRFLTTSGRAGRAIKVRSFDEYRARLLENFVILERSERHNKIARELDAKAQRLRGRVSRAAHAELALLQEVPDLVEYPSVVAGTFAAEFARDLPEEVLITTLVHHQHYFPLEGEDGKLLPAFLAVINSEPDNEKTISRNAERVVTARLRDARFFWEVDRRTTLESRVERLATLVFHRKLGTYKEKAERIERLAGWIATNALGADEAMAGHASRAARLAKADLTADMVREFTELQGTMGGIYAREEGLPVEVWKAIYFHYLPIGVEADAPPTRAQLGKAAVSWAAVALADKLDTIAGLFASGGKPTGRGDPFGLRRAAQGVIKLLVDFEQLTGTRMRPLLGPMLRMAREIVAAQLSLHGTGSAGTGPDGTAPEDQAQLWLFFIERLRHLMQVRGLDYEEIQAVTARASSIDAVSSADLLERARELGRARSTPAFASVAEAYKRANNIVENAWGPVDTTKFWGRHADRLNEPAELQLRDALLRVGIELQLGLAERQPGRAIAAVGSIQPELARFFDEVRVMVDDQGLQDARLALLAELRDRISEIGDISVLAPRSVN
jgi:glycyl-tRNA synthetase beta chain